MQPGSFSIVRDYERLLTEMIESTRTGLMKRQWLYFAEGEVYVRILRTSVSLTVYMVNIKLKEAFQRRGLFSMMMRVNEANIRRVGAGRLYVSNVQNSDLEQHLRKKNFICADPENFCPSFYRVIPE